MTLAAVWLAIRSIVRRGRIVGTERRHGRDLMIVDLAPGEQRRADLVGVFGLASHPPPGSEAVVVSPGGEASDPIVVATRYSPARPATTPGTAVLHSAGSAHVRVEGGTVTISGGELVVDCAKIRLGKVVISGDEVVVGYSTIRLGRAASRMASGVGDTVETRSGVITSGANGVFLP